MNDPLTDLVNDVQNNGVRWVTLVTLYSLYRKERRNTLLNRRDAANFANQKEVMIALGVGDKWKDGPKHGLLQMDLPILRRFFLLSRKETILRRKNLMERLKSRKFWLTILAALIPTINKEFNINLDLGSIIAIMTAIMSGVAALAHVDAKKVVATIAKTSPNVLIDMTFKEAIPILKTIHDGVNDLLIDVKKDDNSQAFKDALRAYSAIMAIIEANKHPEPIAVIVEDKVSA
jgi:hypothetical protein